MSRLVTVNDKMQSGYRYELAAPSGRNFDPTFRPELTPKEMLELGVFCGKYLTDCRNEFPASWFARAKLSSSRRDCSLNYFGVDASQPLSVWRSKGWIHPDDPRGWFQWYCRYYMGRRMPERGRPPDQKMEGDEAPRVAGQETLRAWRSHVPPAPTAGALALGLRQPDHVNDALAIQMSLGTLNDAKPAPAADSARRQR